MLNDFRFAHRSVLATPLLPLRRTAVALAALAMSLAGANACRALDAGRVDSTALQQTPSGPQLRVTIVGDPNDSRIAPAQEAVAYWNREFTRLGRRFRLVLLTVRADSIPDSLLRAASSETLLGMGPATTRLLAALSDVPGDIVIALSHTDLVSFSVRWRAKSHGVVGIRRSDIPPLSMPNTVRNVVAHELGHVLGLDHNSDPTTLMCGRPASCRPAVFASDRARFFPLTETDERRIKDRWP